MNTMLKFVGCVVDAGQVHMEWAVVEHLLRTAVQCVAAKVPPAALA
jgi:hypothetical protein